MFVRFRAQGRRLHASLIATHRGGRRVYQEHIASLGGVGARLSVADRLAFWEQVHPRLARLGNRLDGEATAKILGALHQRIPLITVDERRALQLEVARDDVRFWDVMHDVNAGLSSGQAEVASIATAASAEAKQAAEAADGRLTTAKERIARLERGEDIAGGTVKRDMRQLALDAGMTETDISHAGNVATLHELGAEQEYLAAIGPNRQREVATARWLLRRRGIVPH